MKSVLYHDPKTAPRYRKTLPLYFPQTDRSSYREKMDVSRLETRVMANIFLEDSIDS
jgi:hypothetical protein